MSNRGCCMVECTVTQRKCRGLTFHRLPRQGIPSKEQWRKNFIQKINRSDHSFNPDKACICSRHFEESCFRSTKQGGRRLICGSLPTLWMPQKSVETPKPKARKPPARRLELSEGSLPTAASFDEGEFILHNCPGIGDKNLQKFAELPPHTDDSYKSINKYYLDVTYDKTKKDKVTCTTTIRAHLCQQKINQDEVLCKACASCKTLVLKKRMRESITERQSVVKPNTPLCRLSKKRLENSVKLLRMEKNMALKQLKEINERLDQESMEVSDNVHKKLNDIVKAADFGEQDCFVKLFWEQQKKAFERKPGGMRWHPMMIRLAILLHSSSPAAYRALREIGIVKLPCESTLRDYTNVLHPRTGFRLEIFKELKDMASTLADNERWVCLMHDEISIKADLVYDKRSGELVGFVDREGWSEKTTQDNHLASHALVFMVVGVTNNIKMSLGYFATTTATADQIFVHFWEAVSLLECVSNLKVLKPAN